VSTKLRLAVGGGLTAVAVVLVVIFATGSGPQHTTTPPASTAGTSSTSSTSPSGTRPSETITCVDNPATDTKALQAALLSAEHGDGTVNIAAGNCAVDTALNVTAPLTIEGAGPTATFLVQHAKKNLLLITGSGVTVENINLNNATYNTTAPVHKHPDPLAMITNGDDETVRNVTAEAGSGFGMRFVGPNPCYTDLRHGDVISNVTVTDTAVGGFAAVDVDCQNGATLTNITIHGGILALYMDQHVSLTGETFQPDQYAETCVPPWYVGGPSRNITISNVTSAGGPGKMNAVLNGPPRYAGSALANPIESEDAITVTNQHITNPSCAALTG
jgi:hypothetical protein